MKDIYSARMPGKKRVNQAYIYGCCDEGYKDETLPRRVRRVESQAWKREALAEVMAM